MSEHLASPLIARVAEAHGIATDYWDWQGEHVAIADDTLIRALAALDIDASSPEAAQQAIDDAERRRWQRLVEPVVVMTEGESRNITVHVYAGRPAEVVARLEDGRTWPISQTINDAPDREFDGQTYGEATFCLPADLPLGYHRLQVNSDGRVGEAQLIVSPAWVGYPDTIGDRDIWGYAAQFYSVRSRASWGIGDLVDLADLTVWAKTQHNAGFVLVNPVHASNPVAPLEPSPYLPSSRRYLNPLYIRVEAVPEYNDLSEKKRAKIAALAAEARAASLAADPADDDPSAPQQILDRDTAWTLKMRALRMIFGAGLRPARQMAFDDFRRKEGRALQHFATWCALVTEFGPNFRDWPIEYQRPSSPEVADFAAAHDKRIRFYAWLQWIVDTQLSEAQLAATNVGMPLGIINDLAVGVSGAGADAWSMHDVFAQGVEVGAPPDAYNQKGQGWGQPPWRPDRLADLGYAPFRQMVNGILRHSGGIRVDHVMGMFRLWWVPEGNTADRGTYVRYDHEAMVGILALEAKRAGALLVGEDLGTVEPWVREYLTRRGILGTSVLWFENNDDGTPLAPDAWRENAMASVTTHDLPPTAGYLAGDHVRLRERLGLLTRSADDELELARDEQRAWLRRLVEHGLLDDEAATTKPRKRTPEQGEEIVLALHRYLAGTASRVKAVNLVDAVGDRRTQNQPGTNDEYPNWRVPLSGPDGAAVVLEDIYGSERALRLAAVMNGWETR